MKDLKYQHSLNDMITGQKRLPEYEEIDVLKNHKIEMLGNILQQAVDSKYKISFAKGMIIFLQSVILFIMLLSVAIKANIFSILYLLIVFKYI